MVPVKSGQGRRDTLIRHPPLVVGESGTASLLSMKQSSREISSSPAGSSSRSSKSIAEPIAETAESEFDFEESVKLIERLASARLEDMPAEQQEPVEVVENNDDKGVVDGLIEEQESSKGSLAVEDAEQEGSKVDRVDAPDGVIVSKRGVVKITKLHSSTRAKFDSVGDAKQHTVAPQSSSESDNRTTDKSLAQVVSDALESTRNEDVNRSNFVDIRTTAAPPSGKSRLFAGKTKSSEILGSYLDRDDAIFLPLRKDTVFDGVDMIEEIPLSSNMESKMQQPPKPRRRLTRSKSPEKLTPTKTRSTIKFFRSALDLEPSMGYDGEEAEFEPASSSSQPKSMGLFRRKNSSQAGGAGSLSLFSNNSMSSALQKRSLSSSVMQNGKMSMSPAVSSDGVLDNERESFDNRPDMRSALKMFECFGDDPLLDVMLLVHNPIRCEMMDAHKLLETLSALVRRSTAGRFGEGVSLFFLWWNVFVNCASRLLDVKEIVVFRWLQAAQERGVSESTCDSSLSEFERRARREELNELFNAVSDIELELKRSGSSLSDEKKFTRISKAATLVEQKLNEVFELEEDRVPQALNAARARQSERTLGASLIGEIRIELTNGLRPQRYVPMTLRWTQFPCFTKQKRALFDALWFGTSASRPKDRMLQSGWRRSFEREHVRQVSKASLLL